MLLSVIIVSYNTKTLTVQAIESACAAIEKSPKLRGSADVWVVDNLSSDDSVEAIKKLLNSHSNLHFIQNTSNAGFAAANNLAIQQSNGEFVLLLNSDTVVLNDAFDKMIDEFDRHSSTHLGILSAGLLNQDGTTQAQGGSFPSLISLGVQMTLLDDIPVIGKLLPSTQHTGKNSKHNGSHFYPLDWVGGTAMMIKRDVISEIGLLDDNIFMYGEDVEFCMRAKFHHWDVGVLPEAQITHFGSASSSSKNAIIGEFKGYIYIWAKHKPMWQKPVAKWLIQLGILIRVILFGTMIHDEHRLAIYKEANQVIRSL